MRCDRCPTRSWPDLTVRAEQEKRSAAEAAAGLVGNGMTVGLGTGSTVTYLLTALAARDLDIRCVATSPRTETMATSLGLRVEPFSHIDRFDMAIDGADQVTPERWLIKGGGGAHTREKIVAASADCFVVIVSSDKLVPVLEPPVPLELLSFGLRSTLRALGGAKVRPDTPASPDGGVIADWYDPFDDPTALSAYLDATPGVVAHGLFQPGLVSQVVTGRIDPPGPIR
ncbi:MAG: ribose 5-phosphate isomerase A [Acidimicrobiales bacterium]|nr:ribose 5-phosphate isomerase A [Acidimicrobiales bacterium]